MGSSTIQPDLCGSGHAGRRPGVRDGLSRPRGRCRPIAGRQARPFRPADDPYPYGVAGPSRDETAARGRLRLREGHKGPGPSVWLAA